MNDNLHPDLDLQGRIRPGLDILANEIVIALKKRTRFATNAPVYEAGLVRETPGVSLLGYELERVEQCHAELGRYTFAAQDAFSKITGVQSVIHREPPPNPLRVMPASMGDRIIAFYQEWLGNACRPGDEPNTYGETVTADVSALLSIMERVNLGKLVAESKFLDLTEQFLATRGEREAMLKLIVRSDREAKVIELAQRLADHYELAREHSVSVFKFMIQTTVDIEVEYLRLRIADTEKA